MDINEAFSLIKENEKPYYCYVLRRENMKPFYVGIGKGRRIREHAYETRAYNRGKVQKCNGHKVAIINKLWSEGKDVDYGIIGFYDTWEEACEVEMELIDFIGTSYDDTGCLTNLTKGGEGAQGRVLTEEHKQAISEANSKPKSRESIEKMIQTKQELGIVPSFPDDIHQRPEWINSIRRGEDHHHYGMKGELSHNFGRTHTEETKKKISESKRGQKMSKESKEKISQTMKGVPKTEETKERMSKAQLERSEVKSENLKKLWQDEDFKKERSALVKKGFEKIVECPHCGKKAKPSGNFHRYHMNNCKSLNKE